VPQAQPGAAALRGISLPGGGHAVFSNGPAVAYSIEMVNLAWKQHLGGGRKNLQEMYNVFPPLKTPSSADLFFYPGEMNQNSRRFESAMKTAAS